MKAIPWRALAAFFVVVAGVGIFVLIVRSNNAGQRDFITLLGCWTSTR
jgi:hypothetical protein